MAYPDEFVRLTLHFALPNGERADTSCSWASDADVIGLDDTIADGFATIASAFWTAIKGKYTSGVKYQGCSVTQVATDGTTVRRIDKPIADVAGTNTGTTMPNEVAIVMSLRTALAGRRTRGRMFMPPWAAEFVTVGARWLGSACDDLAAAGADLLATTLIDTQTFTAVVASATGSLLTPVTVVAVGDVPDAQRRRRDQQVEAYHLASV